MECTSEDWIAHLRFASPSGSYDHYERTDAHVSGHGRIFQSTHEPTKHVLYIQASRLVTIMIVSWVMEA